MKLAAPADLHNLHTRHRHDGRARRGLVWQPPPAAQASVHRCKQSLRTETHLLACCQDTGDKSASSDKEDTDSLRAPERRRPGGGLACSIRPATPAARAHAHKPQEHSSEVKQRPLRAQAPSPRPAISASTSGATSGAASLRASALGRRWPYVRRTRGAGTPAEAAGGAGLPPSPSSPPAPGDAAAAASARCVSAHTHPSGHGIADLSEPCTLLTPYPTQLTYPNSLACVPLSFLMGRNKSSHCLHKLRVPMHARPLGRA